VDRDIGPSSVLDARWIISHAEAGGVLLTMVLGSLTARRCLTYGST